MTNKEFFPNARVESAEPNVVETPAQMAGERGDAELNADERESLTGGIKWAGYNHNQNLAAAAPSGGENPVANQTEPDVEDVELSADEQESLAGGTSTRYSAYNHNQNLSVDNTTGPDTPVAARTEPPVSDAELSADEQESLAAGKITYSSFNHNQNLAAAAPSGRYGILATAATGPIVITVERGRLEVFSSPYLAATEPTDDYAVGLPDEIGFHARSNQ